MNMPVVTALLSAVCVLPAQAQTVQEPTVSFEAARRITAAAVEEATRRNMRVSISVLDRSGSPVTFVKMDGAAPGSIATAVGKARTSAAWHMASADFEAMLKSGALGPLSLDGLVLIEGGVPLVVDGRAAGAVGVSGGSSQEDGAVARFAAAALERSRR